eukprot:6209935-Pleurochrysis_carterae.AAC.1
MPGSTSRPPAPLSSTKTQSQKQRLWYFYQTFWVSTRHGAAVNDLTLRRSQVALLRTARDVVACRSALDRDTHPPSPRGRTRAEMTGQTDTDDVPRDGATRF